MYAIRSYYGHVDQLLQQRSIVPERETTDAGHDGEEGARERFQTLPGQRWRIGRNKQCRIVQRALQEVVVQVVIVFQVLLLLTFLDFVERRLGDVDVTAIDQLRITSYNVCYTKLLRAPPRRSRSG